MFIGSDKAREMRLAELKAQQEEENKRYNDEKKDNKEEKNEEKKNSKRNKNFVMFYRENMNALMWLMKENGNAAAQLTFIIENMDNRNALLVSNNALSEFLEVSIATIKRSTKILKENGFIDVLKSGNSNVYVVNPDLAWNSYENEKQYAKFSGNILLSKTENENYKKGQFQERFKKLNSKL